MQPIFRMHEFVTASGSGRGLTNAYIAGTAAEVVDELATQASCLSAMGRVATATALYGDLPTAPEPEEVLHKFCACLLRI